MSETTKPILERQLTKKLIDEDLNKDDVLKPLLRINNLNKYFMKQGSYFKAVNEISFDVFPGDFFGIIGESGSGKSTTGKTIIRLFKASGGTVLFDNKLISQKRITKTTKKWLTRNMQMIFQDPMSSLNPKKNVLSLISEPFSINKHIRRIANQIIKDTHRINPFFQYTYKWEDHLLTQTWATNYYQGLIDIYQKYIALYENYKTDENNNGNEELLNFLSIMEDMEEEYKEVNVSIYQYARDMKSIFTNNLDKFDKHENDKTEVELYECSKDLAAAKKLVKHSQKHWDLVAKIKLQKTELKDYKANVKITYNEQNSTYINSLISSYKSDMKAIKQERNLTPDVFKHIHYEAQHEAAKATHEMFSEFSKFIYLENDDISEYVQIISDEIDKIYQPVINKTIKLQKFDKERILLIGMHQAKKDLTELESKVLEEGVFQLGAKGKEINQIIEKLTIDKKEYQDIVTKLLDLLEEIKGDLIRLNEADFTQKNSTIKKMYKKLKAKNLTKEKKIKEEIHHLESEIEKTQNLANQEKKRERTGDEYKKSLKNVGELTKLYAEKNVNRNAYAASDVKDFNTNKLPKIKESKEKIKNLENKFSEQKKSLVKLISGIEKEIKKMSPPELLNSKHDQGFFQERNLKKAHHTDVHRELSLRKKNIKAFEYELDTVKEEVGLYRIMRINSWILLYLNRNFLETVLTRERVYKALESVGLKNEHAYRYPHEFSGGQRQRIVIARALITNPKVIIADEPISALDVSIQAQVINIMQKLAKENGITFLFIAHDLSMVNYACNRMIIMHQGRIVEKGETNTIFRHPIHPYTKSLMKAAPELSKIHVNLASFSEEMNYNKYYGPANKPSYYSINNKVEHLVFGTEEQIKEWQNTTPASAA